MRFKNLHTYIMTTFSMKTTAVKALFFLLLSFSVTSLQAQVCDNLTDGGSITGDESGCGNPTFDPGLITSTAVATGGSGTIEYVWMKTTGNPDSPFNTWQIIPGANGESYDPTPITETTYYGRCSRRSGCSEYIGETNFVVKSISCCGINAAITASSSTVCPAQPLSLSANGDGTGLTYLWEATGGSFDNSTSQNPTYTMMMEGTYTIKVTITKDGCMEMAETTINVANQLDVAITANTSTIAESEVLQLNSTIGGNNATYTWSSTGGTFSNNTIANPTYSASTQGDFQIYLEATDDNGCTGRDTFDIKVGSCALTLIGIAENTNCNGANDGSITLTPSGGTGDLTYVWGQAGIGNTATPTGLAAGTYTVTATDALGCSDNQTIEIGVDPSFTISADIKAAGCSGENDGQILISIDGGNPDYTYNWSNNLPDANFVNNLAPGTYSLTVTDADGCQATGSYFIDSAGDLTLNTSATTPDCGQTNGTATVVVSGGTAPYTYAWNDPNNQTTATASNLAGGIYIVNVTDANGCQNSSSITVNNPNNSSIVLTTTGTNTSCNTSNGAIDLVVSGGTPGYTIIWDNGIGAVEDPINLAAGTYTVTVTDAANCSNTTTVIIEEEGSTVSVTINKTDITCHGRNEGTATVVAVGGTGIYTYNWDAGLAPSASQTGLVAGTYTVTVTDQNGCQSIASTTITQPALLTVVASPTATNCTDPNGSAIATVTGGTAPYTYQWNDTNNQTTQTAENLAPGNYTVIVTDANQCGQAANVTISGNMGLVVTLTTTDVLCNGENSGTITANVTNGTAPFIYTWNNFLPNSSGFTGLAQGIYEVTVTDANGCFGTASAKVHSADSLLVNPVVENASCTMDDGRARLDVTGGSAPYSYAWGSPLNNFTNTVNGLTTGSYEYTVTDANGCSKSDVIIVLKDTNCVDSCTVVGGTISTTNPTTVCVGDGVADNITVTLTGNQGPNNSWIITDENLNILELPTNNTFNFDGAGLGTCLIWNIAYEGAIGGLVVGQNAANLTGCRALSNSITVIRQDCTSSCTTTPSTISTTDPTVFCVEDGVADTVRINLAVGSGDFSRFVITDTALTILEISTNTIYDFENTVPGICLLWNITYANGLTGLTPGNKVSDIVGCYKLSNAITVVRQDCRPDPCIDFPGSVSINNPASGTICSQANISLSTSPADADFTYSWTASGGSFNDATSATPNYTMMMPGTYEIIVTVNKGTCVTTDTTSVTIVSGPEVVLATTDITCAGENNGTIAATTTGGTAPYTYTWNNSSIGDTANAINLVAAFYEVTVTDANGCTATTAATIAEGGNISVALMQSSPACGGTNDGTITASITGGQAPFTYTWSNGGPNAPMQSNLPAGSYSLTVTDANGCTATNTVTIAESVPFDISIISTPRDICPGGSVNFGAAPAANSLTYQWTASGGNFDNAASASPIYTMMMPGTYEIILTASNGICTDRDTTTVIVREGLTVDVTLTDVQCAGDNTGAINVTANSPNLPITYTWDNGIGNISTPTGLSAGNYNLTVSDGAGCTFTTSTTIGETSNIAVAVTSTNLDCNGENNGSITATTTGGIEPITYAWSNGVGNQATINGLAAGSYSVTATDAFGCSKIATTTLSEPNPIFVNISNSATGTICPGAVVNLTASPINTSYTYTWTASGGSFNDATSPTPVYTMMMAGTHEIVLTVSDGNCTTSATTTVTIGEGIDYTINSNNISCSGEADGSINVVINNGVAPITFNWDNGIGNIANPTGLVAGTYNLTLTDANNCSRTESIIIEEAENITIGLSPTNILCGGENTGAIDALVIGGTDSITYAWSNGSTQSSITNLAAGSYSLTVSDINGCTAVDSVILTESAPLTAETEGANVGCNESGHAHVTVAGGTAPYTYLWNDAAAQTTDTAFNLVAGVYTVVVTDANGCTMSSAVTITETEGITCSIIVLEDIRTFNGSEGVLGVNVNGGSGNYTYRWNNGGMDSTITGLSTDTYIVTITDETGCVCTDTLRLLNPAILGDYVFHDVDSSGTQTVGEPGVEGVTLQLTGTTYYGTSIVRNTTTDADGNYQFPVPPGTYKVTVVDAFGYNFTTQNTGTDDQLDSDFDPTTNMSQFVTLNENDVDLSIDLGLFISNVCRNILLGGTVERDETICSSNADPSIITNVSFPSGGMGQIEYLWLQSDITPNYYPGSPDWTPIPNSNSPDYDPGVITKTTWYVRCARRAGCDSYPGESNIIAKTVVECLADPVAENLRTNVQNGQVELIWEGKVPYENGFYIIERSTDGGASYKVVNIMACPRTDSMDEYHFMDEVPKFGENYYQVKVVVPSMSNAFTNIAMAMVKPNGFQRVLAYPNPVQNEVTIQFLEELAEVAKVQIVNGFGQVVKSMDMDTANKKQQIDLSDLPSGIYYLKFANRSLKRYGQKIYKIEE